MSVVLQLKNRVESAHLYDLITFIYKQFQLNIITDFSLANAFLINTTTTNDNAMASHAEKY